MNNRNGSGLPPGLPANVPILGQQAKVEGIPPQVRLNLKDRVGEAIAGMRKLGLRHGRVILNTPIDSNDISYLLWLDILVEAGCSIVSTSEVLVPGNGPLGVQVQVGVVYHIPAEFDA